MRKGRIAVALLVVVLAAAVATRSLLSGRSLLASGNPLFLTIATWWFDWDEPAEPVRIVGPLYFVGTKGLGAWLFTTPDGHVLLNTGTPKSGPLIVESIRKLGFSPEDVRILLNSHGHSDHAGALAYLKDLSGAQVAAMQDEVALLEDGGQSDFHYGADWEEMGQPPVKVDRVLRDGGQVRLGDLVLTAHHTPGHTRGATTWTTTLTDDGREYAVVFPDGSGVNPGYRVAGDDPSYPGIADDYRRTLNTLETLRPDIWLAHHTEFFAMDAKRQRAAREGVAAWVDPDGYRSFVAERRRAFEDTVAAQSTTPVALPSSAE